MDAQDKATEVELNTIRETKSDPVTNTTRNADLPAKIYTEVESEIAKVWDKGGL